MAEDNKTCIMSDKINDPKNLLSGIGSIVKSINEEPIKETLVVEEIPVAAKSKTQVQKSTKTEPICTKVDVAAMGKIRAICEAESISIKEFVNYCLLEGIKQYEAISGKEVHAKRKKKGNIKDIFNGR